MFFRKRHTVQLFRLRDQHNRKICNVQARPNKRAKNEHIEDAQGNILADGLTNAQAWRFVDIKVNDHLSRAEQTSDWIAKNNANEAGQ